MTSQPMRRGNLFAVQNNFARECYQGLKELMEEARKERIDGYIAAFRDHDKVLRYRVAGSMAADLDHANSAADRLHAMIRNTLIEE